MCSVRVIKNFELARRLKVIYKGDFRAFLRPGGSLIRDNNIDNIKRQVTPSGGRLKRNSPATLKIKAKLGKGQLSLIWDRILISKGTWIIKSTKKRVRVLLNPVRSKIGRYVTRMGYEFFGISVLARKIVFSRWVKFIKRGLR